MVIFYHFWEWVAYSEAVSLTRCRGKGTTLGRLAWLFESRGLLIDDLYNVRSDFVFALNNRRPIVLNDHGSYKKDHWYLIIGYTDTGYWVVDPMIGFPTWRSATYVHNMCDDALAIAMPNRRHPSSSVS